MGSRKKNFSFPLKDTIIAFNHYYYAIKTIE